MKEPKEWNGKEAKFKVNEWSSFGLSEMSGEDMSRHFMILGETGSGKTKSAINPLMNSILNYRSKRPSMLIIDPKNELFQRVKKFENVIKFDSQNEDMKLNFYEGIDIENVTADELKTRILSIFPTAFSANTDAFWINQAHACIKSFFDLDLYNFKKGGSKNVRLFWSNFGDYLQECKRMQIDVVSQLESSDSNPQAIRKEREAEDIINELLDDFRLEYVSKNYFQKFYKLINRRASIELFLKFASTDKELNESSGLRYLRSLAFISAEGTFQGITATVQGILSTLIADEFIKKVNLNPFEVQENCLSVEKCMEEGFCVVYSPSSQSDISDFIGRCLKSKFFEFTFLRKDLDRPFAYVCDEFQRFITSDKSSGEQSFLDRCRAYKAICILASQSIASLRYALSKGQGTATNTDDTIDIILNNTGNKIFFRNTDIGTIGRLEKLIPTPQKEQKRHIMDVRPPSTLSVGECYYLLCSGRWGRSRVRLDEN